MYKVLDLENNKIIVDKINTTLHRHLSGREFTEEDACVKKIEQLMGKEGYKKHIEGIERGEEHNKARDKFFNNEENINEIREAYKAKYNRYPSSKMKLENIIAKL